MNFLAHLYLADDTPASRIGNILPDLIRGRLPDDLHLEVKRGVQRHRAVDAFTDTHPRFAQTRARFRSNHGIFSGILVDVFYDHALSLTWADWHDQPLEVFISHVHRQLAAAPELMPRRMLAIVDRMTAQNWLATYATDDGLRLTLGRMSQRFAQRFGREVDLTPAVDDLQACRGEVLADFADFFPQLIRHVRRRDGATEV